MHLLLAVHLRQSLAGRRKQPLPSDLRQMHQVWGAFRRWRRNVSAGNWSSHVRVILVLIKSIISNDHYNYNSPFGDRCFYVMQNKCSSPQLQLKTPFTRAGFEPNTCRSNSNGQAKKRQELTYSKWQIGQTGSRHLVVIKNASELTILWFEKRQITLRR